MMDLTTTEMGGIRLNYTEEIRMEIKLEKMFFVLLVSPSGIYCTVSKTSEVTLAIFT